MASASGVTCTLPKLPSTYCTRNSADEDEEKATSSSDPPRGAVKLKPGTHTFRESPGSREDVGATSRTIVAREFAVDGSKAMEAFENVPYDGAASSGTGFNAPPVQLLEMVAVRPTGPRGRPWGGGLKP